MLEETKLIAIQKSDGGKDVVSGKDLFEALGLNKSQWARWAQSNIENNPYAINKIDYIGFDTLSNGNVSRDYLITIDFAKRLAMLTRTEKGEQVRKYFIDCEKRLQTQQIKIPQTFAEALRLAADLEEKRLLAENQVKVLNQAIVEKETELQHTNQVIQAQSEDLDILLNRSQQTFTITEIANMCSLRSAQELNKLLLENNIIYVPKRDKGFKYKYNPNYHAWFVYQEAISKGQKLGYFSLKVTNTGRIEIIKRFKKEDTK